MQLHGLRISLQLPDITLHVGQDARFLVRFENRGPATLYLNPHVPPNLHLATTDEQPAATPVSYIAALSSLNPNVVLRAIIGLEGMRAQAAIPALLGLLRHRNATLRSYAAGALSRMSGPGLQKEMRAALGDRDENVQQHALSYLTRHGDALDLERFLTALGSHHQGIREMAREGIRRFGTASTFPRVRALLDKTRSDVTGSAEAALSALTFIDDIPRRTPAQWDQWYDRHRGVTRTEWAREALRVLASATLAAGLSGRQRDSRQVSRGPERHGGPR